MFGLPARRWLSLNRRPLNLSQDYYYTLMERILTFPMHTVAAINGHAFAGGFCLSLCADWRVIRVRLLPLL